MLNNFFSGRANRLIRGSRASKVSSQGMAGRVAPGRMLTADKARTDKGKPTQPERRLRRNQQRNTAADCPLNCPRAGLKLPTYAQARQLAQGWERY